MVNDAATPPQERKDPIASVAGQLSKLSTSDHAALRRIVLNGNTAAEGVVIKLLHYAEVPPAEYERDYEAWRLLAHAAALLSGTAKRNPHNPKRGLGTALVETGFAEAA